jgi:hypothetical protein
MACFSLSSCKLILHEAQHDKNALTISRENSILLGFSGFDCDALFVVCNNVYAVDSRSISQEFYIG